MAADAGDTYPAKPIPTTKATPNTRALPEVIKDVFFFVIFIDFRYTIFCSLYETYLHNTSVLRLSNSGTIARMKLREQTKRVLTDIAGYGLLIAAVITGWLPGPGGIPLALLGLSLLSIHNKWAQDLREYVLKHGGKVTQILFPKHPVAQWAYDLVALGLFCVSAWLAIRHAAAWQVAVASSAFFAATFISLLNRDRLERFRNRRNQPSKPNKTVKP